MIAIASTLQQFLKEGLPDRTAEAWTLVCWRSRKIICNGLRRAGLERNDTTLLWLPEWWTDSTFTQPPDLIEKAVKGAVDRCDE